MKKLLFYIMLSLSFHLFSFKDENYVTNWDDNFLKFFDYSLNPFVSKLISDSSKATVAYMLAQCILNPKTYTAIDNLCQAIQHYKANKDGKTIPATKNLISHMKEFSNIYMKAANIVAGTKFSFYSDVKNEIKDIIKGKIDDAKKLNLNKGTKIIESDKGSNRGAWYLTIGSYRLNIEYKKLVDLSKNKFDFQIHWYGEDIWDFEPKECKSSNVLKKFICFVDNILEEHLPSLIVGEGKIYNISYDFYDTVTIETKDAPIKCSAGQYLSNNKCYSCDAGTFSKSGDNKCTKCSAGTYSNKASSSCIKCKAGTYSNSGSGSCIKCSNGYTSLEGASSCYKIKCPAGQYLSNNECKLCNAGTYSNYGATSCISCSAGLYSYSMFIWLLFK